ncbi:hypothetical protein FB45DRAFT_482643 [Roridomyces roridus]|uniref:Uncharacterized protein n=1 Tax=Roridomyces roridus TaxID=1738132 RepID=A0AAD7FSQ3_9AGAR|nr:hypothetical protein FB45DRAFT_482643 [Roridomyces roridus]
MNSQVNVNSHSEVSARKHRRRRTSTTPSESTVCISASSNKIALTLSRDTPLASISPRSVAGLHHTALGAFTLTGCPIASLRYFVYDLEQAMSDEDASSDPDVDSDTSPSTPPAFTSIPSISRTASPFSDEYSAGSIPPGWPMPHKGRKGKDRRKSRSSKHADDSDHVSLRSSRRSVPVCAGCKKQGSNFPRCRGCATLWCSRECRISSVHLCPARR